MSIVPHNIARLSLVISELLISNSRTVIDFACGSGKRVASIRVCGLWESGRQLLLKINASL